MNTTDPHVALHAVSKSYGGVQAARDVTLEIARGSIHAIVGENGAGKSTISKIIAGVTAPSAGQLLVDGQPVHFRSPRQALAAGVAMIDQELALVPARSVIDNVFFGVESSRVGMFARARQRARYRALVEETGFDLDPEIPVGAMRVADQQKVEILRALAREARFLIMDEPTAPLTHVEANQLYAIIRSLRDRGTTILYISHFLEEVLKIADTVTVMRDGRHVSTRPAAAETTASLVRSMLGRSIELAFPDRVEADRLPSPVLEVRGLTSRGRFEDVSFNVHPGEIVGLAGLIGSGRSEVLRAIFGADRVDEGEMLIDGNVERFRSPRDAIAHRVMMLPESRKDEGLVMTRSVADNIVLSHLDAVSARGIVRRGQLRAEAGRLMGDLDVRTTGSAASVSSLSGGNQQKVLFAKCLMGSPRLLLVDEPTRGVDVGAKQAIYELIVALAAEGMALVVVSSELEEVLGLAHRVLVMRRGRLVADVLAKEASQESVLTAAFGAVPE